MGEARAGWAHLEPGERPLLAIVGATCTGKTALAVSLAARLAARGVRLEVISADARQIFRGLSAGTAKPAPSERAGVAHHMLDVAGPEETYNAARYAAEARACAEEVYARGALPALVGGSGLYIRAFVEGLFAGPAAHPEVRERLERAIEREGAAALHRRLAACDPEAAGRIHPHDRRRLVRALEVFEVSGRPISALRAEGGGGRFSRPLYLGLAPSPEAHARRIEARVRRMLEAGMAEEADRLARSGLAASGAFEGLGYAEALAWRRGALDREAAVERIARLHRRYAKRQRTWFRRIDAVRWLDPEAPGLAERAEEAVCAYLEGFPLPAEGAPDRRQAS